MEPGIAAFLAFVTAIPLTILYMSDKVLIHSEPSSQAKAWFEVFTTAMVIMYVVWSLLVGRLFFETVKPDAMKQESAL